MLERIDNDEEIIAEKAIKIDIKKPKIKIDEMMLSKDFFPFHVFVFHKGILDNRINKINRLIQ